MNENNWSFRRCRRVAILTKFTGFRHRQFSFREQKRAFSKHSNVQQPANYNTAEAGSD